MSVGVRSQTDRRSATVDALLDATIECLIDVGFAGTSTRAVAQRAGVSQGAQQHYFPTKAALVDAAMQRLLERVVAEAASPFTADTEHERFAELLDRLWELHNLPIVPAVLEMFNAARTDPDFGPRLMAGIGQGMKAITNVTRQLMPEYSQRPGFDDLMLTAISTMRGTVVLSVVPGADGLHPNWPTVRAHFLNSISTLPPARLVHR